MKDGHDRADKQSLQEEEFSGCGMLILASLVSWAVIIGAVIFVMEVFIL